MGLKLETLKQTLVAFRRKQHKLNRIGLDLAGLSDIDTLLERALFYLHHDLSYQGAQIELGSVAEQSDRSDRSRIIMPIRRGHDLLGHMIVPAQGARRITGGDKQVLKAFSDFLAVGLSNVKRFEAIRALASTDPLTGIPNRRKFLEAAQGNLARSRTTGVIVFDIDRFKIINDTHGHPAGDEVLRFVAGRAQESVRKTDFLARLGGDEFAILLPDTDLQTALNIAERVRTNVENSVLEFHDQPVCFTVSVGVACIEGEIDLLNLIDRADQALYAAKQAGTNLVRSRSARLAS